MKKVKHFLQGDTIVAYWPRPSSSNVLEGLKNDSLLPRERIVLDHLDRDSCITHGYIYELLDGSGNTIGWLPMDTLTIKPAFEYTVLSRDTLAPVASAQEIKQKHAISLYPNPTTNTHTIQLNGLNNQQITISLFDIQGRHLGLAYNGKVSSNETSLEYNISHLSSGMYLYAIQLEGEKRILRFIKQ